MNVEANRKSHLRALDIQSNSWSQAHRGPSSKTKVEYRVEILFLNSKCYVFRHTGRNVYTFYKKHWSSKKPSQCMFLDFVVCNLRIFSMCPFNSLNSNTRKDNN